jgi:tetratricopeptide (TPR) repeat protein
MLGLGLMAAVVLAQGSPAPKTPETEGPAAQPAPAASTPAPVAAPVPLASDGAELGLRRAKNEYAYGNYERAVEQLKGLLYPMRLTSDDQVVEARKYLALSYYLLGNVKLASEEFRKLLYLSPDYELDPYTVAPAIIETFEIVRGSMKDELNAIRQRQSDEKLAAATQPGFRRTIEITISERSEFATLLPFGIGQFQNGEIGWGIVFLATELALLAANVSSYLWAASVGDYTTAEADKRTLVQRLTVAQYASAALFGVAWSLGVFQARLNFVPIVRAPPVVKDEPLTPARSSIAPGLFFGFDF